MQRSEIKKKIVLFLDKYFSGEIIDFRQIVALTIPVLVDQTFIVGLNLFNTAMISSSGVQAVSAVNMVDSLNLLFLSVLIAVATGGTVVVAQYVGSGNDRMCSKSAEQATAAVLLISLAIGFLLIVFRTPVLWALFGSAEPGVFEGARIYLLGSALSYPAFGLYQVCCCCLRGAGKTKPALALSMITNFSYVFLNVIFIRFLAMGVVGMSIALNLSRLLGAVCAVVYLARYDRVLNFRWKDAVKMDFSIQKKILFIGIPFAAEQIFFNGGKLLTQTFIVELGTLSLAANAIVWVLIMILQIPGSTVCQVSVTVVGQCMGRRLVTDSRKFIRSFLVLSSASLGAFLLVMLPFLPVLINLFAPPPEIVSEVYWITLITGIAQPLYWSQSFLIPTATRAAGDGKYTSLVSLICMWSVRVGVGWAFSLPLGMGLMGIYLGMLLEWAIRAVIFVVRLRGKKWYEHYLID